MSISKPFLFCTIQLFLFLRIALCSPPGNPVKCVNGNNVCKVTNFMGSFIDRSICKAAEVAYPTSEQELIVLVATATKKEQKMKVITRHCHSLPKLICPDGDRGLLISTKHLKKIVKIDRDAMAITVESGATLEEIIKAATEAGLALPYSPYFYGLTIGGLLSTGAHGSSLKNKGGAVHEYVTALRIVSPGTPEEGFVIVRNLNERDEDLNAAKVSLGVLGVISQVTLQLQPLFKRSITFKTVDDSDIGDQVLAFGNQHEFADITWYPVQQKAVYRIDDRVPFNTSGDGRYDHIKARSQASIIIGALRTREEIQEATGDSNGKCTDARTARTAMQLTANGLTNNGLVFTGYPVIGYQNNLQAFGSCLHGVEDFLITACGWDPRIQNAFYYESDFCIALPKVKSFIQDVKTLVSLEPNSLCGLDLYGGMLLRYIKASTAYLGKQEDCVDFSIPYYRSKVPMTPRLHEDAFEEIEQMAAFKYGGLPHWGKNRNIAFDRVAKKYEKADKFLEVKGRYDPKGLFSSQWTDKILGLQEVSENSAGCALDGLCVCSEDAHCAPSKGYFCMPGKVYSEARVCAHVN